MRKQGLLAALLMLVTVTGVESQGIYKTIGPDGKPVFSDKPPRTPGAAVEVIKAPPPAVETPAAAPASVDADAASEAATVKLPTDVSNKHARRIKRATRVEAVADSAPGAVSPALEKAVIGVLGLEDLMTQTVDLCMQTLPSSFGKYADAADAWRARNKDIVTRAHAVLESDMPLPRATEAALKLRDKNSLAPVASSDRGARIRWCDQSMESLERGELDPSTRPALAGPLLGGG